MLSAWQQRPEPLGLFVGVSSSFLHQQVGDRAHRFVVRDARMPLLISLSPHLPLRVVVACLAIGRRVGCFLQEEDDVVHAARRVLAAAPGHIAHVPVAVWNGARWESHRLSELA